MKAFFLSLIPSFVSLVLFTILLGILYPVFMFCIGQVFFHEKANGTLFYYQDGSVIGSAWIGQNFAMSKYFQPRPSSAGNGYDPTSSSGSNLGPTSQKLHDALVQRVSAYRSMNNLDSDALVPADAVMGSGSGLDPHISVANAMLQASRVAKARGFSEEGVKCLIKQYTEGPTFGLFGESRINVLRINLALDKHSEGNL